MLSRFAAPGSLGHAFILASSLALAGAAYSAPRADEDANLSALLKRQTQSFSEAGQRGDAVTINRYLDRDVVFTNETGAIATKKELVEGTTPTPANAPKRRIEVTNWALRRQGDVATATFVDEVTQDFQGQTLVLRFQSTETWAKRPGGWKMIASHTMNVPRPPVALALAPADLDAYVGIYEVDSTYVVKISRDVDGLTASANGGSPVPLKVEIKDVLFTQASPNVRKIFQRDAAGHVIGYINRRDGADLIFKKVA
jgi:ketosteroid isomerase-like protein